MTPLLIPLIATFGVQTVKLSGRRLGFTGGTVDKFESVEGFNVEISRDEFPFWQRAAEWLYPVRHRIWRRQTRFSIR